MPNRTSSVFVYRWVEFRPDETGGKISWYGNMARYKMAVSRKKGYEEAEIDGLIFAAWKDLRYGHGPVAVYSGQACTAAFAITSEKDTGRIYAMSPDHTLKGGLLAAGINMDAVRNTIKRHKEDIGSMADRANLKKFHLLRISLHTGDKDEGNGLYEAAYGRWRYGSKEVYGFLTWGLMWLHVCGLWLGS
jgi:hypothetical protein